MAVEAVAVGRAVTVGALEVDAVMGPSGPTDCSGNSRTSYQLLVGNETSAILSCNHRCQP